jgi:hypothetical protein
MTGYVVLRISKSVIGSVAVVTASLAVVSLVAEIALRTIWPQEIMTPTYMYSEQYVNALYPNTEMVEEKAGHWRFTYTINSYGYRGRLVKPSNEYAKKNLVLLGDSYTFGEGVDDGDEYAAVLDRQLQGQLDVVNLGVPGWGLTQQIRRYFEFGILYKPAVVVLQFSANDPLDNLAYPVARIVDGRFVFEDDNRLKLKRLNKWLGRSPLQRLHVYNFMKQRLWRLYDAAQRSRLAVETNPARQGREIPFAEENHLKLLELFVASVTKAGTHVLFLPVGESLRRFAFIGDGVYEIAKKNDLFHVLDTAGWFAGVEDYSSPEGHAWGQKAHAIIGRNLAAFISGLDGLGL